jgi:hypothetical protein
MVIPEIAEESYSNYHLQIKAGRDDVWSAGKAFAIKSVSKSAKSVALYGSFIKIGDLYLLGNGFYKEQYAITTIAQGNYIDSPYIFRPTSKPDEHKIVFQIHNRTTYKLPIGTELIVVAY